jgi:hypothetical protein
MVNGRYVTHDEILGKLRNNASSELLSLCMDWGEALAEAQIDRNGLQSFYSPEAKDLFSQNNFLPKLPTRLIGEQLFLMMCDKDVPKYDTARFTDFIDSMVKYCLSDYAEKYHELYEAILKVNPPVSMDRMNLFLEAAVRYREASPIYLSPEALIREVQKKLSG